MKNLDYYIEITDKTDDNSFLSLIEPNISGGTISKETIDKIRNYPQKKIITISGLKQDTFEYFIENYGSQFEAINFWKCPLVTDFSCIELLSSIKFITYFWNQRVEKLWDFTKTSSLKGFCFDDFTRMHHLIDVSKSVSLEEFQFGDKIWTKYVVKSLAPLIQCKSIRRLTFSAKKVEDNLIEPLAELDNLEQIDFPMNLFSTEQIAWLKAHLPSNIESKVLQPTSRIDEPLEIDGKKKDTFIIGKRKPFLSSRDDSDKIKKYIENFNRLYIWYQTNLEAKPDDYKKK